MTGFNAQPELVPQFEVVLDEVQALPNRYQGAHSELGLAPDLLTVGNIIRGGFPVGALAGRSCSGSATTLEHAGTFNGVWCPASLAALGHFRQTEIDQLHAGVLWLDASILASGQTAAVRLTRAGQFDAR